MEREDLQLRADVHDTQIHLGRHHEIARGEREHSPDAGRHDPVADLLGTAGRHRQHRDRGTPVGDHLVDPVEVVDLDPGDECPDHLRVDVQEPDHRAAPVAEARVARQRVTEVPDPHDAHQSSAGQPECGGDALAQTCDVVADPTATVRPQERQILPELRRAHPGHDRDLVGGCRRNTLDLQHGQRAQVSRQPVDGRGREGSHDGHPRRGAGLAGWPFQSVHVDSLVTMTPRLASGRREGERQPTSQLPVAPTKRAPRSRSASRCRYPRRTPSTTTTGTRSL